MRRLNLSHPHLNPSRRALLPLLALLFTLASCHINDKFSSPLWFYRYSSNTPSLWDSVLTRLSYLNLQPDGSYTQDFGRFDYGKWKLQDNDLYLTNQKNTTYIYHLPLIGAKELEVFLAKGKIAYFQKQPRPSSDPEKNPFSLVNNRWRIPATHKESIEEIRQRLLNHLHFWETYFIWGDDNNTGVLDVTDVPTPLKVYGNGFGLRRFSDLPPQWKSYFFDSTDCHAADTLIKAAFKRNKIKWPDNNDDENKLFISGIQQVEAFLRP